MRPTVNLSAETLIQHLGLTPRLTAEVQDMYSRPIATPVLPLAAKDRQPKRPSRPVSPEPEREAA